MNHNQQASLAGHYDDDEALFVNGVIRVGNRDGKRVVEDGGRLRESDAVLTLVRRILSPVPLKCDSIHLRSSLAARATSPYFPRLSPSARIRLWSAPCPARGPRRRRSSWPLPARAGYDRARPIRAPLARWSAAP